MGKAYSSYSISDIYRLNLSFMKKNRSEDEVSNMSGNLAYLVTMASSMNSQGLLIKPFLEVFDKDSFHTLTKQDMNKTLHELTTEHAQQMQALSNMPMSMGILDKAIENGDFKENTADEIHTDISNNTRWMNDTIYQAEERYTLYQESVSDVAKYNKKIAELEDKLETLDEDSIDQVKVNAIKEVIAEGIWQYLGKNEFPIKLDSRRRDGTLYDRGTFTMKGHLFVTTQDIICQYFNPAAGINVEVNFGRVGVTFKDDGSIRDVRFMFNYMKNTGVQHPHVSGSSICWGNAQSRYLDFVKETKPNFKNILGLFKTLLETYCPDNPYETLNSFKLRRNFRSESCLDEAKLEVWPDEFLTESDRIAKAKLIARNLRRNAFLNPVEQDYTEIGEYITVNFNKYQDMYHSWYLYETNTPEDRAFDKMPTALRDILIPKDMCEKMVGVPFEKMGIGLEITGMKRAFVTHSFAYHDMLKGAELYNTSHRWFTVSEVGLLLNDSDVHYCSIKLDNGQNIGSRHVNGIIALGGTDEGTN